MQRDGPGIEGSVKPIVGRQMATGKHDKRQRALDGVAPEIVTVGLDLAKNVFQVHGADDAGRAVLCKKLRRDQVLAFFSQLPP